MNSIPDTTTGLGKLASGVGNVGLREQPVRRPGPDEALLEVIATGICGTDLHVVDDEFAYRAPVTMGHEVTGEVLEVGSEADPLLVGQRVACETYTATCRACYACREGKPNLCPDRQSIGSFADGGFARYLTLPARNLHVLPDHVGRHAAALAEPLACVTQCLFDPPVINSGDLVLVTGPGTMGLLCAQVARAAGGLVQVAGLARDRMRLELAGELGFETAILDEDVSAISAPDVFCECSGAAAAAILGLEHIKPGGRYVQVGIFGQPVTVPLDRVLFGEIVLTSGNASTPTSWRRAMDLLAAGLVDLDVLLTEVVPLRDWERAFQATRDGSGLKYVLDPRAK